MAKSRQLQHRLDRANDRATEAEMQKDILSEEIQKMRVKLEEMADQLTQPLPHQRHDLVALQTVQRNTRRALQQVWELSSQNAKLEEDKQQLETQKTSLEEKNEALTQQSNVERETHWKATDQMNVKLKALR